MTVSQQLASRFREVILHGKWIANTNLKEQVSGLSWELATRNIGSLNTIALLTFHLHYYIGGLLKVLRGGPLDIRDQYSFDMPPIQGQEDWEKRLDTLWHDAEQFALLVEQMPDAQLQAPFVDVKYGNYQRNLDGMIEHCYYHLGQIVLIKKLLRENETGR